MTCDLALTFGIPAWCGGMLEAGIGCAHSIHLSPFLNLSKPGDTSSAPRYWATNIVNGLLEVKDSLMAVPRESGIGGTSNWDFIHSVTVKTAGEF